MMTITGPGEFTDSTLARHLSAEFGGLDPVAVERCVADVAARLAHLGLRPGPADVERIAREHLVGIEKSVPPSGRPG